MKPLLAISALALLAPLAHADSTYTYTGNTLDQPGSYPGQALCSCNITGEMTFAEPLVLPTDIETVTGTPTSYSFTVDGFVLNQTNSTIQQFGLGDLNWLLDILGNNGLTIYISCVDGCGDGGGATDWAGFGPSDGSGDGIGITIGHPGSWAVSIAEPASLYLLGLGLAAIALRRRAA